MALTSSPDGLRPKPGGRYEDGRKKESSIFAMKGSPFLKLHGSIEWEQELVGGPTIMEHLEVHSVDLSVSERKEYRPAVIFGHRNKLTAEGPFLDLLHVFVEALESSNLLAIIGFSFGDPHVNELLTRWINGRVVERYAS